MFDLIERGWEGEESLWDGNFSGKIDELKNSFRDPVSNDWEY